jgi:membrane-bound lytic murein transglycosylase B
MASDLVRRLQIAVLTILLAVSGSFAVCAVTHAAADDVFAKVKARLVQDGFAAGQVGYLFGRPDVVFETHGVSLFFRHSEARLDYNQFTRQDRIAKAREYMQAQADSLAAAEGRYGVPGEVITAILLVETQLGTLVGRQNVFNILATMAALDDRDVRDAFWEALPADGRLTREAFESKADAKSRWGYGELKALLELAARDNFDPLQVMGSYAGAMGICQFMPSNALTLGVDGNGNGRVDLFDHADAIASVGNYLKHHGWRRELGRKGQYAVILKYNYSKPYATIILKIARILKG